ncbi:MAG TPA: alpha-amylase family glycosyl hydrolase [Bacilli bacterium]|nr:alpha-amylase family glycosyl hydrolase [Bacilli bacterium]
MEAKKHSKFFQSLGWLSIISAMLITSASLFNNNQMVKAETSDVLTPEEYEDSLITATWVQSDHLYLHYLREDMSTINDWGVWAWNEKPADTDGDLYANWFRFDQTGAIMDISLLSSKMINVVDLGFLIVLKSSMAKSSGMWTSDSGGDVIVENVKNYVRSNGSIHIFVTQGKSMNPEFVYQGSEAEDPYADDDGSHYSRDDVNSNVSIYTPMRTSQDFQDNVGVGYEIMVSSFADSNGDGFGDINGITAKLDYIDSLSVGAIWLTPIQKSESYHGYDTIDYYNIDSKFGTIEDYRKLVYEAHKRNIRVLMDLVVNHTSLNHYWFKKSAMLMTGKDIDGNDIDYRNFYHWKYSTAELSAPWYRYGTTNYYYYAKFASSMPELNYDYQGTRNAIIDVAKYWLGFGIDGFRIDAVKHVYMKDEVSSNSSDVVNDFDAANAVDYSTDRGKNINFFLEFSARIKSLYPNTFIVGENFDGWDQRIAPYYQGMDSQFDFAAYYHNVYNTFYDSGENTAAVEANTVIKSKLNLFNASRQNGSAINSPFTSNHDVERMINHVNNSLVGSGSSITENSVPISSSNYELANRKARAYLASQILMPGVSWIFYGDEIGLSGNKVANDGINSPERAAGTDWNLDRWYRQPMKWSDTDFTTTTDYSFTGYKVEWDNYNRDILSSVATQEGDDESLLTYVKGLTSFKTNSAYQSIILKGTYNGLGFVSNKVMAYSLSYNGETLYFYINFGNNAVSLNINKNIVFSDNLTGSSLGSYGVTVLK